MQLTEFERKVVNGIRWIKCTFKFALWVILSLGVGLIFWLTIHWMLGIAVATLGIVVAHRIIYKELYDDQNTRYISDETKKIVLEKQNGHCVLCPVRHPLEYHHVRPFSMGGENTPSNIIALCANCHRVYSQQQREQWRGAEFSS